MDGWDRSESAVMAAIITATGWQSHTADSAASGTLVGSWA